MTEIDVLKECTVEGNNVKLPEGQLDRKLYVKVAKKLELIGGKWKGRPVFAFQFPSDPTELLEQIANGEARNLKKEYQYFATPADLADVLCDLAELEFPEDKEPAILEPSAGQGAIVEAINRAYPEKPVCCYEAMPTNVTILRKNIDVIFLGEDFLQCNHKDKYDRVIANPPFSKNQDIDHVYKMYEVCKPGGIIVTITGEHWTFAQENKCNEFRFWLEGKDHDNYDIPRETFKESRTMVGGRILVIRKE